MLPRVYKAKLKSKLKLDEELLGPTGKKTTMPGAKHS
jgi:hypothetical protein